MRRTSLLPEARNGSQVKIGEPVERPLRVLHVTEALAAGVGLSMSRLAQLQADAGAEVGVLALPRYDTPDDRELRRWLGGRVVLKVYPMKDAGRAKRFVWLAWMLLRSLRSGRFDVVHFHSSFAGAIGRLVAAPFAGRVRVFYSPHGFAFLRSDLGRLMRATIRGLEWLLAKLPGRLLLVSESELAIANRWVTANAGLLENGVNLSEITERVPSRPGRMKVVMIGRITEQKAPWRFASAARALASEADFEWLGYGPDIDVERWLRDSPVHVTGRLSHAELLSRLQTADVVFFPTLWEGMPLSLIEAQAVGLPVVASDIEGNRDVVVNGRTGVLASTDEELLEALKGVLRNPAPRAAMATEARKNALRFSDSQRGMKSFAAYGLRAMGMSG